MKSGFFIWMLIFYLLGNIYIFWRIWQMLPFHNLTSKIVYIFCALLLCSSLFMGMFLSARNVLPMSLNSALYQIGSTWIIIFLYLLMFILLRDIILIFIPRYIRNNGNFHAITGFISLGFALLLLIYGHINYLHKKHIEINISSEKLTTEKLKIVAISDLHLGYNIGNNELAKWIKIINNQNPDIILIAGDIIDNNVEILEKRNTSDILRQLHSKYGVYACFGNHDYFGGDLRRNEKFITDSDITLLADTTMQVAGISITGRADRSDRRRKPLKELVATSDTSKFSILLDHQPYNLNQAVENGIDLQISGHTHRGQIFPINLLTDRMYELSHGYMQRHSTHFYVSSGIGIWGGKFRIGSQSEYIVINLNHPN
ncbi:MAG: metallophosphoesterase [Culturomica sp.]|nr:metallophosphoesterase [Culturomica sp.]